MTTLKLRCVLCVALLLVLLNASAQFRKIPAEVTDSFKARFDKANQVSWKDNVTAFQATFKIKNDSYKALYDSKGDWLKTERTFMFDALPKDIKEGYKKSKYTSWPVKEILYIEEKDKEAKYRIQVRKSDLQKKNLLFSRSGQLLDDSITL